jgi:hypothetical protein
MGANGDRTGTEWNQPRVAESTAEPIFETQYEYGSETEGLTVVIIDAIADAMGVSPTEVAPRISDSVDPDAMERVLRPRPDGTERSGRLTFYLCRFRVTIDSDGTVTIHERGEG